MEGTIHQEEISILNIYAPNTRHPFTENENSNDLTAQIDTSTVIVGDLNTPLSPIDMSSRQKINKETSEVLPISIYWTK
jgi:hypothetical protein